MDATDGVEVDHVSEVQAGADDIFDAFEDFAGLFSRGVANAAGFVPATNTWLSTFTAWYWPRTGSCGGQTRCSRGSRQLWCSFFRTEREKASDSCGVAVLRGALPPGLLGCDGFGRCQDELFAEFDSQRREEICNVRADAERG